MGTAACKLPASGPESTPELQLGERHWPLSDDDEFYIALNLYRAHSLRVTRLSRDRFRSEIPPF
jgi:hypothetical protein